MTVDASKKRWSMRLLLLPFAAITELLILAACWITAIFSPARSGRMMRWATRTLPHFSWYIGEQPKQGRLSIDQVRY